MTIKQLFFSVVLLPFLAAPVSAQRFMVTGETDTEVLAFFGKLQKAVAAGDRAAVSTMVHYPLRVNRDATHHTAVATPAELLKQYDAIFTPTIRQAIVNEKAANLQGFREGVMIKAGLVWFAGTCDHDQPPKCTLGLTSVRLGTER